MFCPPLYTNSRSGVTEQRESYRTGDFIVVGSRGGQYVMQPKLFAERYDSTNPRPGDDKPYTEKGFSLHAAKGGVWARKVNQEFIARNFPFMGYFFGIWKGVAQVRPGDYLAVPYPAGGEGERGSSFTRLLSSDAPPPPSSTRLLCGCSPCPPPPLPPSTAGIKVYVIKRSQFEKMYSNKSVVARGLQRGHSNKKSVMRDPAMRDEVNEETKVESDDRRAAVSASKSDDGESLFSACGVGGSPSPSQAPADIELEVVIPVQYHDASPPRFAPDELAYGPLRHEAFVIKQQVRLSCEEFDFVLGMLLFCCVVLIFFPAAQILTNHKDNQARAEPVLIHWHYYVRDIFCVTLGVFAAFISLFETSRLTSACNSMRRSLADLNCGANSEPPWLPPLPAHEVRAL